jgi:hypothetical protein
MNEKLCTNLFTNFKNRLHESHLSLSLSRLRGGWGRAGWAPPDAGSKNEWMNEKLCTTNLVTNFKTCFTNHMSMEGGREGGGVGKGDDTGSCDSESMDE